MPSLTQTFHISLECSEVEATKVDVKMLLIISQFYRLIGFHMKSWSREIWARLFCKFVVSLAPRVRANVIGISMSRMSILDRLDWHEKNEISISSRSDMKPWDFKNFISIFECFWIAVVPEKYSLTIKIHDEHESSLTEKLFESKFELSKNGNNSFLVFHSLYFFFVIQRNSRSCHFNFFSFPFFDFGSWFSFFNNRNFGSARTRLIMTSLIFPSVELWSS